MNKIRGVRQVKILSVDDEKINQDILKYLLGKKYDFYAVSDGQSALELINKEIFDVILMDLNLGRGINGVDVLKKLRNDKRFDSMSIIALTAYVEEGTKERLLNEGFDDYLSMPFTKDQLGEIIQRNLKSKS